jgi:hypothetical protein
MALLVALLIPAACSLSMDGDVFRNGDEGDTGETPDAAPGGGGAQADAGANQPDPDPDAATPPAADASPEPGEPDAAPPECSDTCMMCGSGCCTQTCGGGDNCRLNCNHEECDCALDCAATEGTCEPRGERGATCAIDCSDVNDCRPRCREGACEIDCTGANNCDKVECTEGASCLLQCTGANNCEFERCEGEQTSCPGDILACNRDCP